MKITITWMLLFLFGLPHIARPQIGTFYSTSDNELSSSLINAIYQDKQNYIWVATEDGLNRFDGVRFAVYKNLPGDFSSIKNNYVRSLFEDTAGRFWVGCINGLHLYNRVTDKFTQVKLYSGERLLTPHITSIIETRNHEIWIATSEEGIIRIRKDDTVFHTDEQLSARLSSRYLTCLYEDSNGYFWIASENQGLNRYNPATDEVTVFKAPDLIKSNQISAVCEDRMGNIFVGTLTNGLHRLNPYTQRFEHIPYRNYTTLPVKCLTIDNRGRLLVGTDGQGIKIYNPATQELDDYLVPSASFDFSRTKVHAICQDRAGNIWSGLFQKGVFLAPESPNKFNYWGPKSHNHNIIGSGCIMSLLKDKNGILWIGTDNDGAYSLDKQGYSRHYPPSVSPHFLPNTIMAMIEDDEENIWMGSFLGGLCRFDKRTGQSTYFNNQIETFDNNSARDKIFCLAKDRNRLWIGTNGAGVYLFDLNEKRFTKHYSQAAPDSLRIVNDWINCIVCDSAGVVWIGSYKGVCSINPLDGHIENYTEINRKLPGNIVYCIEEDKQKSIWIGTTEGLARLSAKRELQSTYTVTNGLPSNVICGMLEDEADNIWLSTHSGISKFSVAENKFVNYDTFDGLQGNEFSMGAAFKADDGEMFFGGINGISAFLPGKIVDKSAEFYLYLTGLYILDKPVAAGQKSGDNVVFDGFIGDVDTICLSYRDNMFALEFSTFEFGAPERVSYRYMLEGLNNQWVSTERGTNRINFTNINYGTYRLRVKAFIYDNFSEERIITLIIMPPWYLDWWAKLLYLILAILLIWGIGRFVRERIRHKNELIHREHAEQISEAKLQFFINVSHEIRTPMTLIISPLEKLISENTDREKQPVYLLMYRNAQRILRLINQMMDVRKIDKGQMSVKLRETDMVGFVKDLMQTFEYQSNKRNIRFDFFHDDDDLKVWIDMDNFDKVLVNILSNAFKFTPDNGEVTVRMCTATDENSPTEALRHHIEIVVSDTGKGIEESKIEK
ncbi:MAG: hybrid sensor histidine kinase/response regulator, partial [Bacteroidales bacterium]|nr:hybrid sensor histidine kinase/response regulator [Bacteroidales bacterium]